MASQPRPTALIFIPVALGLAIGGAWVAAGLDGVAGVCLAAALSAISFTSLKLLANAVAPPDPNRKSSNLTAIVILTKLPFVVAAIYFATRLSMSGLYCFLATLGLVYSAIVWRLARAAS